MVPADGEKSAKIPTVNVPDISKLLEVVTVAKGLMVILLKLSVPELEIEALPIKVIVPAGGERLAEAPTTNAPEILKLLEVVTLAEGGIVRL